MHGTGQALSSEAGWRSTRAPCTATSRTSSGSTFLAPTDTAEAATPSEAICDLGLCCCGNGTPEAEGYVDAGCLVLLSSAVLVRAAVVGHLTLEEVKGALNTKNLSVCCNSTGVNPINSPSKPSTKREQRTVERGKRYTARRFLWWSVEVILGFSTISRRYRVGTRG